MYTETVEKLQQMETEPSKFGTERTRALLDALGSPDRFLKIIHVAGTNGKGSTCAYLTSILCEAGKSVGTFTSPAVYTFAEKFSINGAPLSERKLDKYLKTVLKLAEGMEDKPTAFEIETAAALYAFYREGCSYCVLECGMGGRFDATNAIAQKSVAVILSIGLEHTAVLGDTIPQICSHKAGIIQNCPAVISAYQTQEGRSYFESLAKSSTEQGEGSTQPILFAGDDIQLVQRTEMSQTFLYKGDEFIIHLYGTPQLYNAAAAIEVARFFHIREMTIKTGLRHAKIGGRVERIQKGKTTYILDGSHNPPSFTPLLEWGQNHGGIQTLIYGCLSDKDVKTAASLLGSVAQNVICVKPQSYRAMDLDQIEAALRYALASVQAAKTVTEALEKATGSSVVVCGSFTLLKEAKTWIEQRP